MVVLVLWLNVLQLSTDVIGRSGLQASLGLLSREDYLAHNLGWYAPAVEAVNDLSEGSRTVMLWEPRSLYCAPGCDGDEVLDRWLHDITRLGEPGLVLEEWLSQGYSHVLVHHAGAEFTRGGDSRYKRSDWRALEALLASLRLQQDFGGAYALYELK
jgi:hypothetical protein